MIFVVAFRGRGMGFDTTNYWYLFEKPSSSSGFYIEDEIEPGVVFINRIVRFIWNDVKFASFVKAIIGTFPIFFLFYKISKNGILSIFLYATFSIGGSIYLLSFAAERQSLALGMLAVFLYLYHKANYKLTYKNSIVFGLMILCHYSSLEFVLVLILLKFNTKKSTYLVISLLFAMTGLIISKYADLIFSLAMLFDKGFYLSNADNSEYNFISLLPYLSSFLICLYYMPKEKTNTIWFKGFFISVCLTGFLQTIGMNIERICAYFYICTFIALPDSLYYMRNKIIKYGFLMFLFSYFSYKYFYVFQIVSEQGTYYVPYKTFFE